MAGANVDIVRMNLQERLNLIKDLIDLITDMELEDPRCDYHTIYGYMSFQNLYYDNNGTLKMREYPDRTHRNFEKLCRDRQILNLREGFAILCTRAVPDSIFRNNSSLRRDYQYFKSLAELDLSTAMFRDLVFHWVFMDSADKLRFVSRAYMYMGSQENQIWGQLNTTGDEQLASLMIPPQSLFARACQELGFQILYMERKYENTISSVITYWRDCEIHLNQVLLKHATEVMTPEERQTTKLHYSYSEIGDMLCQLFPVLVPILWNFFFSKGMIRMDFHNH